MLTMLSNEDDGNDDVNNDDDDDEDENEVDDNDEDENDDKENENEDDDDDHDDDGNSINMRKMSAYFRYIPRHPSAIVPLLVYKRGSNISHKIQSILHP